MKRLEQEIEHLAEERRRLAADERGVIGRIDALAAEARLLDAKLDRLDLLQDEARRSLSELEGRQTETETRLEESRRRLRRTVLLLHQAGPLGRVRLLVHAPDAQQLAAGWRLAHELTYRQRDIVTGVRASILELSRVRREREDTVAELARLAGDATTARRSLLAAIRERQTLLAEIRTQANRRREAIEELERASRELGDVLAGRASSRPVTLDILRFRGLLPMPTEGAVTRGFGDQRDRRSGPLLPHRGWDIDAPFGSRVRAVFDGKVVWSSWFRGYGLMVVVDHGRGVHTVYAHLSATTVVKGDDVTQGQLIGTVGDTGSLSGPGLYVEVRRGGAAENPMLWIRKDHSAPDR